MDVLSRDFVLSLVQGRVLSHIVDGEDLRGRDVQVCQIDLLVQALILQLLYKKEPLTTLRFVNPIRFPPVGHFISTTLITSISSKLKEGLQLQALNTKII